MSKSVIINGVKFDDEEPAMVVENILNCYKRCDEAPSGVDAFRDVLGVYTEDECKQFKKMMDDWDKEYEGRYDEYDLPIYVYDTMAYNMKCYYEKLGLITFTTSADWENSTPIVAPPNDNGIPSVNTNACTVLLVGGRVLDVHRRFYGVPVIDYIEYLYKHNEVLRLYRGRQEFAPIDGMGKLGIPCEMAGKFMRKGGLTKAEFEELRDRLCIDDGSKTVPWVKVI